MNYHIDTGLIFEKVKENGECPLCAIREIVEEQFLHEFLNDAVMEDNSRIAVREKGFCRQHFNMLLKRQNKLSVALQIRTRIEELKKNIKPIKNVGGAKKQAKAIEKSFDTCVICDLLEKSMIKYYKTVAELFSRDESFVKLLKESKGFCLHHYSELLSYSSYAGLKAKEYLKVLEELEKDNVLRIEKDLKKFCDKHDYRNIGMPLGDAETALQRTGEKLYGKDIQ